LARSEREPPHSRIFAEICQSIPARPAKPGRRGEPSSKLQRRRLTPSKEKIAMKKGLKPYCVPPKPKSSAMLA
jgi:hypothetical protein